MKFAICFLIALAATAFGAAFARQYFFPPQQWWIPPLILVVLVGVGTAITGIGMWWQDRRLK